MEVGHLLEDLLIAVEVDEPINNNTRKLINKAIEERIKKKRKAERQKRRREKRYQKNVEYFKKEYRPLKKVVNEEGEEEWVEDISLEDHLKKKQD